MWAERADEVELLAHEYVKGWVASVGKTQGLYLHILLRHIPEETRKWGDLRVRSPQGRALSQESQAYWLGGNQ